jgi:hypothetical protein
LDAEPLARGQVYALLAADLQKLLVDQIVTISELTRRRSIAQVRVLIVYHGDSLISKARGRAKLLSVSSTSQWAKGLAYRFLPS